MSCVLSSRVVKVGLILRGLVTLIGVLVHLRPERIYRAWASLGAVGVAIMLTPSTCMYLVDCLGWRLTLGQHNAAVPFSRFSVIRSTGELMNATTPTAYVGGEPLRAHLLKQYGIPMVDGLASVIVATTAMTIGQIVYILLGIGPGVWILFPHGPTDAGRVLSLAAVLSLALLLFRTALFLLSQRRGLKEPWSGLWCGLSKKDETILSGRQDSPRSSVPLDCRLDSSQRMGGESVGSG